MRQQSQLLTACVVRQASKQKHMQAKQEKELQDLDECTFQCPGSPSITEQLQLEYRTTASLLMHPC